MIFKKYPTHSMQQPKNNLNLISKAGHKPLCAMPYRNHGAVLHKRLFSELFLIALFSLFLYKYSININGGGISANYLYILLPAIIVLCGRKLRWPNQNWCYIMVLYTLILLLSTFFQLQHIDLLDRRFISFFIFMSIFSYMFININLHMVRAFKLAIIFVSVFYSLDQVVGYFLLDLASAGFHGKDVVGSQRYGFVYILAIWLLLHYFPQKKLLIILKFIGLTIVLSGLVLTFSRSGIVAIIGSLGLYFVYKILGWLKRLPPLKMSVAFTALFYVLCFVLIVKLLSANFHTAFDLYSETLFSLQRPSGEDTFNLDNPEASEGYRIFMLEKIMNFVASYPFTGSGYLGVWILFDDAAGSAHNQYTDVLFRTGIFGFLAYAYLLIKLLMFLHSREPGLFWGVIGILIYGLFHETFKESQGAFILAFLLGMMVSSNTSHAVLNK